jgi:hypothetical protein
MALKNVSLIKAKVEGSFNELSGKFSPELLFQSLLDLCAVAENSPQFASNITELVGETGAALSSLSTDGLPLGTSVIVPFNNSNLSFILTDQDVDTLAPYVIKSADSTLITPRAWVRSNVICVEFDIDDLDGSYDFAFQHSLGFPFVNVLVFTTSNVNLPSVTFSPSPTSPNDVVIVHLGAGFEGTYKLIISY